MSRFWGILLVVLSGTALAGDVVVLAPESVAVVASNELDSVYCSIWRRSQTPEVASQCRQGQQYYHDIATTSVLTRVYKVRERQINSHHVSECLDKRVAAWQASVTNAGYEVYRTDDFGQSMADRGLAYDSPVPLPDKQGTWREELPSVIVGMPVWVHATNTVQTQTVLLDIFGKPDTPQNRQWVDNGWQTLRLKTDTNYVVSAWQTTRQAAGYNCTPAECVTDRLAAYTNVVKGVNVQFQETTLIQSLKDYYGLEDMP